VISIQMDQTDQADQADQTEPIRSVQKSFHATARFHLMTRALQCAPPVCDALAAFRRRKQFEMADPNDRVPGQASGDTTSIRNASTAISAARPPPPISSATTRKDSYITHPNASEGRDAVQSALDTLPSERSGVVDGRESFLVVALEIGGGGLAAEIAVDALRIDVVSPDACPGTLSFGSAISNCFLRRNAASASQTWRCAL